MCLCLSFLTGCNKLNMKGIEILTNDDPAAKAVEVLESKAEYYAANPTKIPADFKAFKAQLDAFLDNIKGIWGEDEAKQSGPKDYVKYTDQYYNRAHINFESGTVTVETLAPDSQQDYLKKAIVTTLLTPDDPSIPIAPQWKVNPNHFYMSKYSIRKASRYNGNGEQIVMQTIWLKIN